MSWTETESLSFTARHDEGNQRDAERVLVRLEKFREELSELFDFTPHDVSVVIHPNALALSLAQPWLPLARRTAAPAGRRYFAGWFSAREIHVLAPEALRKRASNVPGSREALELEPEHEYAHLVVGANNPALPPPFNTRTFRSYVRWAWLCEGAATWLSGQTNYLRPAIVRRMREGGRPSFPPDTRDAPLLGGTVFDLLEGERDVDACVDLATRFDEAAARRALENAFGMHFTDVERAWREHLTVLTAGAD
jgi:hypothetical protein